MIAILDLQMSSFLFPHFSPDNDDSRTKGKMSSRMKTWIKTVETNMWSKLHVLQTILHFIQVCKFIWNEYETQFCELFFVTANQFCHILSFCT